MTYTGGMKNSAHILVVDDNDELCELVGRFLRQHGFRTSYAEDGDAMKRVMAEHQIDLVVLDIMLPGDDGLALCRYLRGKSTVPIIMLTALGDETDRIIGLEMGADDYLAKPFNPRELLARIKSVLRRTESLPENRRLPKETTVEFDLWTFSIAKRQLVTDGGVVVPLSTGEFKLLLVFIQHPGHVLSRDQLLDLAQGRDIAPFDRSIDTQVSRLRKKLEVDPKNPELIKTIWGGGYVFTPSVRTA